MYWLAFFLLLPASAYAVTVNHGGGGGGGTTIVGTTAALDENGDGCGWLTYTPSTNTITFNPDDDCADGAEVTISATGLISTKVKPLADLLEKGVTSIEYLGQYLQPIIPVFMFVVGVYVQGLPRSLEDQIGLDGAPTRFETLNILGLHLDPNTTPGMVATYVAGSLLVAAACFGGARFVAVACRSPVRDPNCSRHNDTMSPSRDTETVLRRLVRRSGEQ